MALASRAFRSQSQTAGRRPDPRRFVEKGWLVFDEAVEGQSQQLSRENNYFNKMGKF